ncbi:hypothetical protein COLO4_31675 [Corchorus olitorius]|uniref:Uncharacterized protein n=1 Tax=Corchorus olitorius TaxID=93759 RepID=A0A1R3H3M4_9ROSI|nr:hypothetical protein COLO4_31675 [Corchorus olitorius]
MALFPFPYPNAQIVLTKSSPIIMSSASSLPMVPPTRCSVAQDHKLVSVIPLQHLEYRSGHPTITIIFMRSPFGFDYLDKKVTLFQQVRRK